MLSTAIIAKDVYKTSFMKILIFVLALILPIQLLYTLFTVFLSTPFNLFGLPIIGSAIRSFLMIVAFFLAQIPFVLIYQQYHINGEIKISTVIFQFLRYAFPIYMISLLVSFFVTVGFIFFVIPGMVILVLFTGLPQVKVMEDTSFIQTIRNAFNFGRMNFGFLVIVTLCFVFLDILGSTLTFFFLSFFTDWYFLLNIGIMLVNALTMPFFAFMVTEKYIEWSGEEYLF
ncbi:hypothetical protein [Kroppenstedtia guangzhouensis]|uniref:hypothetical protein n=1 Tax=Kroppenstedtia guangzhouensis TaxID=1274356 RepID=UPI00166AC4C9|nr:hypothetical protein [Kroppenstedtia guangzhouensis]